jgi:hypothetical protein
LIYIPQRGKDYHMRTKVVWIVSLLTLSGLLIWVFSHSFAETASEPCQESWPFLSEAEREGCIEAAGGMVHLKATDDALLSATTRARSTMAPLSGLATEVALTSAEGTPTSTRGADNNGTQSRDHDIRELLPEDRAGGPFSYRYYRSVWQIGSVMSDSGEIFALYAMTPHEQCAITTTTVGDAFNQLETYEREWTCPQERELLSITGATAPTGIISFTTSVSETGTFNLDTEEWTLDGEPWLPTATPTP